MITLIEINEVVVTLFTYAGIAYLFDLFVLQKVKSAANFRKQALCVWGYEIKKK